MATDSFTFEDYQTQAAELRRNSITEGWQATNAAILTEEALETIYQHGSLAVFTPGQAFGPAVQPPPSVRFETADEMGDVLWALADSATRAEIGLSNAAGVALEKHIGERHPVSTFSELGSFAIQHAHSITVPTKNALTLKSTNIPLQISLQDNPFAVYGRVLSRVLKSLHPEQQNGGSPTAIDFEEPQELSVSIGEALLALAFISEGRLQIPPSLIATWNIAKLTHRREHGKANDLDPNVYFAQNLTTQ